MYGPKTSEQRTVSLSPQLRRSLASLTSEGRRIDAVKLIRRDHNISLREALKVVDDYVVDRSSRYVIDRSKDHQRSFPILYVAAVIFLTVGVAIGSAAVWIHQSNERLSAEGATIEGQVTGLQSNGRSTSPMIEYNFNEVTYEYRSNVYSNFVDYEVGENISLIVDPASPHSPLIDDAHHRYTGVVILSVVAIGMMLGFCLTLVLAICQR